MADILRERLSLALDQSAVLERQVGELQTKTGRLEAQLAIMRGDRDKVQRELHDLQETHQEEVRIEETIEFRRGLRTSGKWQPFCPKCHMPAFAGSSLTICSAQCGWAASYTDFNRVQWIIQNFH